MIATGGAVLTLALVVFLFRLPRPGVPVPVAVKPTLVLTPAVTEEAALFDPTALFLRTARNGSPRVPPPERGGTFADYHYPAEMVLPEDELKSLKLSLGPPITVPANPAEALWANPPGNPLLGIGRSNFEVPQLIPRSAFVEVTDATSGRRVWAEAIPGAHPPEPFGPDRRPAEFTALVDPAGLVGAPVATESSGSDTLDDYFAGYLARTLRVGDRLSPGIYLIFVGP